MEFERLWRARGTPAKGVPFVESSALVFPTVEGAAAALRVAGDLAHYLLAWQPKVAPSAEHVALGDETVVLAGGRNFAQVWRKGTVVAVLHVRGRSPANARDVALDLSRRQEQRIEKPTPLPRGVNDDLEVVLDNPRLRVPVYWLGRRFGSGHGFPRIVLKYVLRSDPRDPDGIGNSVSLWYGNPIVSLDLWKPARWTRFARSSLGRRFFDPFCAHSRTIQVRRGYAVLYAGYDRRRKRRPGANCPKRSPDKVVAHVHLPGAVVTVDLPTCVAGCSAGFGPYLSFRGLAAVARGLRRRQGQPTSQN
jgi:hypothetical protein